MTRWIQDGRWAVPSALYLVIFLLSLASSHLPIESSFKRLGSASPKRIRTCPSELSPASLRLGRMDRESRSRNEITPRAPDGVGPSFPAVSPLVESRLAVAFRSPDYLHFFASPSSHSHLSPPGGEHGTAI